MAVPGTPDGRSLRRRLPLSRRWNVAFNLITVGFCMICALFSLDVRRSAWEQARVSAGNLASVIQTDIERNIELYDLSLQAVVESVHNPEVEALSPDMQRLVLFDRAATGNYLGSITVIDEQGKIAIDSRSTETSQPDYDDRDFLGEQARETEPGLQIGGVTTDRLGQPVIRLSRRLSRADGHFAGVVVGTLRVAYFDDLFRKLNLGSDSTISLLRTDGTVLARRPFDQRVVGHSLASTPLFAEFGPKTPHGTFEAMATSDGIMRFYTYGQVGTLPLILTVGISTGQIDAAWRRDTGYLGVIVALLVGAAVFLNRRLRSEFARRLKAEEALSRQARTDSLIGLSNRRHFDEKLEREWRRALRARTALGLLMIDADHFKSYNDRFGHQAGDELLAALARCIAATTLRATDFTARYGGEEFVVLLSGPDATEPAKLGERICQAVAAMDQSAGALARMTVSIGVALIVPTAQAMQQDLVGAADRALFEAKQGGRNRVVAATPSVSGRPRLVA
jgi:diguanylate cyclase (GGDEF)-like protein